MTNQINKSQVKKILETGQKSFDQIARELNLECDMGHIHNRDELSQVLRDLRDDGDVILTVDREYDWKAV